ncbi:hypothetical protein ACJX0J_019666, partial [Zea mays]
GLAILIDAKHPFPSHISQNQMLDLVKCVRYMLLIVSLYRRNKYDIGLLEMTRKKLLTLSMYKEYNFLMLIRLFLQDRAQTQKRATTHNKINIFFKWLILYFRRFIMIIIRSPFQFGGQWHHH